MTATTSSGKDERPRGSHGRLVRRPETAERDKRVIEMRRDGMSFAEIGAAEGINQATAYRSFQRGMATIPRQAAQEYLEIALERMEQDEKILRERGHHPEPIVSATGVRTDVPNVDAATRSLAAADKVRDSRARLLGLNAPTRSVIEVRKDAELDARIERNIVLLQYRAQLECIAAGGVITIVLPAGVEPPSLRALPGRPDILDDDEDDEILDAVVVDDE